MILSYILDARITDYMIICTRTDDPTGLTVFRLIRCEVLCDLRRLHVLLQLRLLPFFSCSWAYCPPIFIASYMYVRPYVCRPVCMYVGQ